MDDKLYKAFVAYQIGRKIGHDTDMSRNSWEHKLFDTRM